MNLNDYEVVIRLAEEGDPKALRAVQHPGFHRGMALAVAPRGVQARRSPVPDSVEEESTSLNTKHQGRQSIRHGRWVIRS